MTSYRPSCIEISISVSIFLLFLIIGLMSGLYWWFILWFFVLVPPGLGYVQHRTIVLIDRPDTVETEASETDELLKETKLSF